MTENDSGNREAPKVALQKKIVPFDHSEPDTEPLFINYVQASYAAGSAYLDVGVIPLDEIIEPKEVYTFHVLTRLVMSKETLIAVKDQILELLERTDGNGEITKIPPKE